MENLYAIWSYRNRQWWMSRESGYTPTLAVAGYYTKQEAADIVFRSLPGSLVAVDNGLFHLFENKNADEVEGQLEALRRL